MSCSQTGLIDCDTVQIIEPKDDLLVDVAGTTNDLDERGEVELTIGQRNVIVLFQVPKLNANYTFEYLYVDAEGNVEPGAIQVVPTVRLVEGFAVVLVGTPFTLPVGALPYVLHWRVVVHRSTSIVLIDAPEDLYLQMPRTNTMSITFHQPRSGTNYGFSELRVENTIELPGVQALIGVQVYRKTISGFLVAVNPTPRSDFYFLKVRTP